MDPLLGSIILFAGNFTPRGWAACNGQILSIAQNNALFALLGTTYGGDGMTTFALPDLRGRVPIGFGQGNGLTNVALGEAAGAEKITLTVAQMPQHSHTLNGAGNDANASDPTNAVMAKTGGLSNIYGKDTPATAAMNSSSIGNSGASQPVGIRNPYLGLNYIIAVQGIFPSRD